MAKEGRVENLVKWKPGQSGNPSGRPKGRSFKKILTELMEKKFNVPDPYDPNSEIRVTTKEALALKLIDKGIRGDIFSIREIRDMTDGPIKQQIEIEDKTEPKPLSERAKDLAERLAKFGLNENETPKRKNKKTG